MVKGIAMSTEPQELNREQVTKMVRNAIFGNALTSPFLANKEEKYRAKALVLAQLDGEPTYGYSSTIGTTDVGKPIQVVQFAMDHGLLEVKINFTKGAIESMTFDGQTQVI